MAAYDFPDTAGKPTDGSFEYTAPDGTLYEWNGYAWVVPSGDDAGSGGGGAARVLTQVLPPSPAVDGDMYWCTDDGRLYLYYDDADTSQWVDASPDNKAGSDTGDTYWTRNGTTLSPANAGDSVDIGSGNIELNATDGSASFAGDVKIGTVQWNVPTGDGIYNKYLSSSGYAEVQINNNAVSGSAAFGIRSTTGASGSLIAGNIAVNMFNDGSANFAGGRVQVNADGSAEFNGAGTSACGIAPNGPFGGRFNAFGSATSTGNGSYEPDRINFTSTTGFYVLNNNAAGVRLPSGSTDWTPQASSSALKDEVSHSKSVTDSFELVKSIKLHHYYYKTQDQDWRDSHPVPYWGPYAEELQALDPDLFVPGDKEQNIFPTYNAALLEMHTISALQTALTRIEALEETNASLEARLTALEGGSN